MKTLLTLLLLLVAGSGYGAGTVVKTSATPYQNYLVNGGFDLWQRGSTNSYVNSDGYLADRWFVTYTGTSANKDRNASNLPAGQKWGIQVTATAASWWMCQRIESANTFPFSGQKMALSGYERSSSGTSALKLKIDYANSVDTWGTTTQRGKTATGFTSALTATTLMATTSSTLTAFSYTFTVSADMATNGFQVCLGNDSSVTTTYQLSAIVLNEGASKQKFQRFGRTFDGEVVAAQRFFEKSFPLDQVPTDGTYGSIVTTCSKYYSAGNYTNCPIQFIVQKFKKPGNGYLHTYDLAGTVDKVSDVNPGNASINNITNYEAGGNATSSVGGIAIPSNQDNIYCGFNYTVDAEL